MLKNGWLALAGTVVFLAGLSAGSLLQSGIAHAQAAKHVYELRTYTAPEGKLGDLHTRFRDHTIRIFNKHGMKSVIYLAPQDAPDSQVNGRIVSKVVSVFGDPTDYSPMK